VSPAELQELLPLLPDARYGCSGFNICSADAAEQLQALPDTPVNATTRRLLRSEQAWLQEQGL